MHVINNMERSKEIETIKTILLSSLIVMAFMTVVTSNQAVMASDDIRPGNVLSRMEKVKECYSLPSRFEKVRRIVVHSCGKFTYSDPSRLDCALRMNIFCCLSCVCIC
jgi:hypothetical protein